MNISPFLYVLSKIQTNIWISISEFEVKSEFNIKTLKECTNLTGGKGDRYIIRVLGPEENWLDVVDAWVVLTSQNMARIWCLDQPATWHLWCALFVISSDQFPDDTKRRNKSILLFYGIITILFPKLTFLLFPRIFLLEASFYYQILLSQP